MRSRISASCGAARMLRWPSARGPNSSAPSIQPTTTTGIRSCAVRSISVRASAAFVGGQIDRLVGTARRSEEGDEFVRIRAGGSGVEIEVIEIEREGTVLLSHDHLAHLVDHRRLAVAGQSHHLILIFIDL